LVTVPPADYLASTTSTAQSTGTRSWTRRQTATDGPKLAACGKIAMSIAMGYMLILML
jgi:hypothetical protein